MIKFQNIFVEFDGQNVVRDFSCAIPAGSKAVLAGPSGCGKTTLLRCLLGFVRPQAGSIMIDDTPLNPDTIWTLRRRMAYVAQEPDLGEGQVQTLLERQFRYKANLDLHDNLQKLPELLETFKLPAELRAKDMAALSGGEKQRVALIAALLLDRPILLLDEITSALDRESCAAVLDCLRRCHDTTMLIVAHHADMYPFADQVIELTNHGPRHGVEGNSHQMTLPP